MIFHSLFKQHTVNMRLLLIALTYLTVSSAFPEPKHKRDVLPGDPRYGIDHHLDNVVQVKSFDDKSVVQDVYGPPGYQPGAPLGNDYLSPLAITEYSTPVAEVVNVEPEKVVSSTTFSVPVESVETVNVTPPPAPYGIPVDKTVKTAVNTESASQVKSTVKTVNTRVHEGSPSTVNIVEHWPTVKQVTHFTNGAKINPSVTKTVRKNVLGNTLLPTVYASYGGVLNIPGYVSSQLPSLYSTLQSIPVDHAVNLNVPLSLSSSHQLDKTVVPTAYSVAQPAFSAPHTHILQRAPVHTLYALPSVSSLPFETLSPIQPVSSVGTLTPVHATRTYTPVQSVETLPSSNLVHTVESVKSVKTSSPVQHAVPTVVESLTPVVSVSTASPLQSVDTVDPIKSVRIVSHQPVETQHSVTEVLKTKSVPVIHISDQGLQDKQFLGNFFYQLATMYLPNFSTLRPPSSTSTSPSSSSSSSTSRAHSKSQLTTSQPVKVTTPVTILSDDTYNQELVNNPVSASKQVVSVTPANEYVQPTEANGGYVY
ncbi:location of vulva defective 1-like isoform X1 [Apis dorsata]|uniref:location of vulva defective 1-like isoform X1 n=1 Tax=Apis dorsata TaxID=7462 RepID=UPI0003DF5054|nr:location of vulva defective 1-like isoform X1 [Apis dorsata]